MCLSIFYFFLQLLFLLRNNVLYLNNYYFVWSFKEIAAAIIMFDVSNSKSLENIKKWQKLLKYENKCNHNHPILLIGNKNDQLIKYNKKVLEEILHDKNITYFFTIGGVFIKKY